MKHLHSLGNIAAALLLAAGLLTACTQDDLSSPIGGVEGALPEGKYPLQIGSITLTAEVDGQPWTRVGESEDRQSSHWDNGDKIQVQIGNGTSGTYTYQDGSLTVAEGDAPAYWASKADGQSIRAWHTSSGSETVELNNQTNSLAYVLTAQTTANFDTQVSLSFAHALAKVRVVLEGDKKDDVTDVEIQTYTSCILGADGTLTAGDTEDFIPMVKATDNNGETFWEANVMPGQKIEQIKVNGNESTLSTSLIPLVAKVNTITLTVNKGPLQPGEDGKFTIDGGDVTIKDYNGTAPIVVNGNATITIENIQLTTEGTAMTINNGASVKLNVVGQSNSLVSQNGSGIGAYDNSNINIIGNGADGSKLTVVSGNRSDAAPDEEANVGIGFLIGGYGSKTYGNIIIDNVTLDVTTGAASGYYNGAAIGLSGRWQNANGTVTCGDIKITDSNVTCKIDASSTAACIGTNHWKTDGNLVMGGIYIESSTITATSGKDSWRDHGACIGLGCIEINSVTMKRIEINNSTLNLTSEGDYKVGKGTVYATATITEGIFVDGSDKGADGWNP